MAYGLLLYEAMNNTHTKNVTVGMVLILNLLGAGFFAGSPAYALITDEYLNARSEQRERTPRTPPGAAEQSPVQQTAPVDMDAQIAGMHADLDEMDRNLDLLDSDLDYMRASLIARCVKNEHYIASLVTQAQEALEILKKEARRERSKSKRRESLARVKEIEEALKRQALDLAEREQNDHCVKQYTVSDLDGLADRVNDAYPPAQTSGKEQGSTNSGK